MRIALVNPRAQRRGGEVFSRRLAEALARRGHAVLEIYLYPRNGTGDLPPAPAEVCLGRAWSRPLELATGSDPGIARRLRGEIDGFGAQIVQVSGGKTLHYAARALGDRGRRPLLVYRNIGQPGVWQRGRLRRWLYARRVYPRIEAVGTVARSFVPRLEQLCPNARIVRCIPGGIDLQRLEPTASRERIRADLGTAPEAPVVLFAGGLSPEKRVDRLLRAFAASHSRLPDAVLWIAGSGHLEGRLRELGASLGIDHRLRFLGVRSDIGNVIAASDLVALTSDTEGVPAILQEAAALGRATVATRVGAASEAVAHEETGLLVDPGDSTALTRALFDLLADEERRRRLGDAAAQRFRSSSLTIDDVADAYEALYRDALAARGSEPAP